MPIALTCSCGRAFHLNDNLAGRTIRCADCNADVAVPAPQSAFAEGDALGRLLASPEMQARTAPDWQQPPPVHRQEELPYFDLSRRDRELAPPTSVRDRRLDRDYFDVRKPGTNPGGGGNANATVGGGLL